MCTPTAITFWNYSVTACIRSLKLDKNTLIVKKWTQNIKCLNKPFQQLYFEHHSSSFNRKFENNRAIYSLFIGALQVLPPRYFSTIYKFYLSSVGTKIAMIRIGTTEWMRRWQWHKLALMTENLRFRVPSPSSVSGMKLFLWIREMHYLHSRAVASVPHSLSSLSMAGKNFSLLSGSSWNGGVAETDAKIQ